MEGLANIFANSPLDRATHRRTDDAWLTSAQQEGLVLPLWRGQIFVASPKGATSPGGADFPSLGFLRPGLVRPMKQVGQIFLGEDRKGKQTPYFACPLDDHRAPEMLLELGSFLDLRELAAQVSVDDSAIAAQARALTEWHKNHIFCARCGQETLPLEAGHKRFCARCELEHFPRTDPVVIMMITHGDKAFLGRQAAWPAGFYSALAGFVEPGETIEEAVARESFEEAHIEITKTTYHSTQPWPYPYSLMIGCFAEAASLDFEVDGVELESGRWFERAALKAAFEAQSESAAGAATEPAAGAGQDFFLPPPLAIAHRLIHHFVFSAA